MGFNSGFKGLRAGLKIKLNVER